MSIGISFAQNNIQYDDSFLSIKILISYFSAPLAYLVYLIGIRSIAFDASELTNLSSHFFNLKFVYQYLNI